MDFSDIQSYPSPDDRTRAQIQSTDSHGCERYLVACQKLVGILSDLEIDIKSVHYKYRLERFHRSRSKLVRRFYEAYESRFPELAISKDQLFIYEPNGNIRIDTSHPTTSRTSPPKHTIPSSSSKFVCERNKKSPKLQKIQPVCHKTLPCWTVAVYQPFTLYQESSQHLEDTTSSNLVERIIPLPWIVKRIKNLSVDCDLRQLFRERVVPSPFECDLRPLFSYFPRCVERIFNIAPLFFEEQSEEHLPHGPVVSDERFETILSDSPAILYFSVCCDERASVIVFALFGVILFLLCYACLGEMVYISMRVSRWTKNDDETHTL